MSVRFNATTLEPIGVKLSTTSATNIAGSADGPVIVDWVQFTEIAGSTPALTIELYDGSTSYYLRKALAMTPAQEVLLTQSISLAKGWYLRATASSSNQIDVVGAQVVRRPGG